MRSAIMFGAGNVGRGFIGQLFCESGYQVTFVDIDDELVAALAADNAYRLQTVFNDDTCDHRIAPVTAVHGSRPEAVAAAVAGADLGATAVGARALPHVVPALALGIERRLRTDARPLNVIICENLHNAARIVRDMVRERIPQDLQAQFEQRVGFVDTVIGRMVPIPTPEMRAADVSFVRVEPYKELPVDRGGFVGPVPQVTAMEAHDHFERFTARKLYIHNCGHAVLAYVGYLRGWTYGWEALGDPQVRDVLEKALRESRDGIVSQLGADRAWLDEHISDLLQRFGNRALGDTIFRLGRDPVRKLQPDDRLVGAARCAEQAGGVPLNLAQAIAAALLFRSADDPVAVGLQERIRAEGVPAVLTDVTGIRADEPLGRAVLEQHALLSNGHRGQRP